MQLTKEQKNLLEAQTSQYQTNLHLAQDYLEGRGLTEAIAVTARLGVVDVGIHGDTEAAYSRLSIPYLTRSGVVSIRYRCLRGHACDEVGCSKYLGGLGEAPRIYGVEHLVSAGSTIGVVEGELDALTLWQLGHMAVGIPGSQIWKQHWGRLFEDFGRIIVLCDGDPAGERFGKSWAQRFPRSVEVVQLDEHEDVNSMFLLEGGEYFDSFFG